MIDIIGLWIDMNIYWFIIYIMIEFFIVKYYLCIVFFCLDERFWCVGNWMFILENVCF